MLVLGLTGGIGSGKSTVARLLAERGAMVVDADLVARQVVEPGQPAHAAIVARFGTQVLDRQGRIDRAALAAIVFDDPGALADLNAITHPAVAGVIAERLAAEAESDHVVVLDVPLLAELGRTGMAGVVVVDCPEEVAIRRLVEQRGMAEADARRRVAAQASRDERRAGADVVIDNSGPPEELRRQLDRLWGWIESLRREARS